MAGESNLLFFVFSVTKNLQTPAKKRFFELPCPPIAKFFIANPAATAIFCVHFQLFLAAFSAFLRHLPVSFVLIGVHSWLNFLAPHSATGTNTTLTGELIFKACPVGANPPSSAFTRNSTRLPES